ncbi:MAG: BlaI/MecI/CopY family transcriptional regulator [Caulobacteraceae bacterium]|nr:MAG: BlaI/MecI/CopY family transcriptional regulator [Caulobacteraceae bacterium]
MAVSSNGLGKMQLQIMQILWERGHATAREITEELNRRKSEAQEPTAHSTVQTLLRKLEAKGAVTHTAQERTFTFHPVPKEEEVTVNATRDLLARIFNNSAYGLVSHLIRHEKISPTEMRQLRELIEAEGSDDSSGGKK